MDTVCKCGYPVKVAPVYEDPRYLITKSMLMSEVATHVAPGFQCASCGEGVPLGEALANLFHRVESLEDFKKMLKERLQ